MSPRPPSTPLACSAVSVLRVCPRACLCAHCPCAHLPSDRDLAFHVCLPRGPPGCMSRRALCGPGYMQAGLRMQSRRQGQNSGGPEIPRPRKNGKCTLWGRIAGPGQRNKGVPPKTVLYQKDHGTRQRESAALQSAHCWAHRLSALQVIPERAADRRDGGGTSTTGSGRSEGAPRAAPQRGQGTLPCVSSLFSVPSGPPT